MIYLTEMEFMGRKTFDTDINNWDVSNVTNMNSMFANVNFFNKPLNNWDVSNVENMIIDVL